MAALRQYEVLDTLPEQALDDLTSLAAAICGTPIAMISLVDEHRQWFKSKVGTELVEAARDISFCGHAMHQRDLFVVPDAMHDERFADNPLVTGTRVSASMRVLRWLIRRMRPWARCASSTMSPACCRRNSERHCAS